ncbi:MAG: MotA/TolQ/ExbB proton channel family protein [Prevotella sp.]|nr:MotA/TolQ/ExbB proton channel family protein [Prevotella sp.]
MKRIVILSLLAVLLAVPSGLIAAPQSQGEMAQQQPAADTSMVAADSAAYDMLSADSAMAAISEELSGTDNEAAEEGGGLHKQLKRKFMEGSAGFMSLVALALVLGLAFCIERLIYLTLSEVNARRLMKGIDAKLELGDVEGAKDICRDTRGPVASICYQGLLHVKEPLEQIDRQLTNYGSLQVSNMEKGCTWIRLFIAVAPSLGFLGTVIGMVMAFDRIQTAGDISPTIVAEGMKVALITTIFGIIVAIVLQFFYNYILSKIERLTAQMEESAITLMDSISRLKVKDYEGGR